MDRDEELLSAALSARANAHAPYSHYAVGAALLAEGGEIIAGCNVENASFGMTVCAEQVALSKAIAQGTRRFHRLVVITDSAPPAAPCGICRQMLHEFSPDLSILLASTNGDRVETSLPDLLPAPFGPADLLEKPE